MVGGVTRFGSLGVVDNVGGDHLYELYGRELNSCMA